jgi:hypothetical protein
MRGELLRALLVKAVSVAILGGGTCLVGCTQGATDNPAQGAQMRVIGAQFVEGTTPPEANGPEVASVQLPTNTIWPGDWNKLVSGALGASAAAATLALRGDEGYWIVTAGVPDVSAPALPTFHATASFSTTLTPGEYTLEVRAVEDAKNFGPPIYQKLTALAAAPARAVAGALVITLTWDTESDLDLHVVDPLGNEIFHGAPSSRNTFLPGSASDQSYGTLDEDSNADCILDGLRQEDVTWADQPPSGHYLVRVDTASLCDQASAHWKVEALLNGTSLGRATGTSLDSDTWGAHDRGAGLLALQFDVP